MPFSEFETDVVIRPDDIDMNNHVHSSKYMDYVLAARYDQMQRHYKMSMNEFLEKGMNWYISACHIEFKREMKLGDEIAVRTKVAEASGAQARVSFKIIFRQTGKSAAEGYFLYTLINTKNGRPVRIPDDVVERYSI